MNRGGREHVELIRGEKPIVMGVITDFLESQEVDVTGRSKVKNGGRLVAKATLTIKSETGEGAGGDHGRLG